MHFFKCWWWFRYSEMAFFTHIFFFDLDFSYSRYIMLHEATAKLMFLVFFVVSSQRGAPFLMYGMVDSSFINNELCVCVWMCFQLNTAFESIRRIHSSKKLTRTLLFCPGAWTHSNSQELFLSKTRKSLGSCPKASFTLFRSVTSWACRGLQEKIYIERNSMSVSRIAREDL